MNLFYKESKKELLEIRNKIFIEKGIPNLLKNGFQKSPFKESSFGKHPNIGYSYELCRIKNLINLEIIVVNICRDDRWIQINLNIFEIENPIESIESLNNLSGIKFHLPPNSKTEIRIHSMENLIPLFNYNFMLSTHKLKKFYSKNGLAKNAVRLAKKIEFDMINIENFVKTWHKINKTLKTTTEGKISGLNGMTVNERLFASGMLETFDKEIKTNKDYAINILRTLEVDENSINEIINNKK